MSSALDDIADSILAWLQTPWEEGDASFIALQTRSIALRVCVTRGVVSARAKQPEKQFVPTLAEAYLVADNIERLTGSAVRVLLHVEGRGNKCDLIKLRSSALAILNRLYRRASLYRLPTLSASPSRTF